MFVAVNKGILYPAPSSPVIDSSIDSLQDRPSLVAVKQPLGMASSPIVAPQYDSNGQLRVDDPSVETPSGLGSNIFKDRGAQDRADFVGPSVLLVQPIDNDVQGLDTNPEPSVVELTGTTLPYFDIQLFDGIQPSDPGIGSRVNPDTVQSSSILLYRDGVPLVEGSDYSFGYNATSGIIRLQPLAGIWPSDSAYTIRFVNTNESSITAQNGANYTDALSFDIIDDAGSTTTFEFDTGYIVTIQPPTSDWMRMLWTDRHSSSMMEPDDSPSSSTATVRLRLAISPSQLEPLQLNKRGGCSCDSPDWHLAASNRSRPAERQDPNPRNGQPGTDS